MEKGRIILTSHGLNSKVGKKVIIKALEKIIGNYREFFFDKTIILCTIEEYCINQILEKEALSLGFQKENITIVDGQAPIKDDNNFDVSYVSEGNTFQLLDMLQKTGAKDIIIQSVKKGGYYIGASAGAVLATTSIEIAGDFERNFVHINNLHALDILPPSLGKTAIIPHYSKAQLESWKNASRDFKLTYDYLDFISEKGYKIF